MPSASKPSPPPSTLDEQARTVVTERLQPLLIELIDLELTAKQLHWTVTGPQFVPVHEQLDELVDAYRAWADEVAERLTAVGVAPDGRLQRVATDTKGDSPPEGWQSAEAVVAFVADRAEKAAMRAREALDALGEADPISEDLVIEIVGGLEKQLWMVAVQRP